MKLRAGAGTCQVADEYGVSPSVISTRFPKKNLKVSETAMKLADAHESLAMLPLNEQYAAINLAEKLRSISHSLSDSAVLAAMTSHRLAALANAQVCKVDDVDPTSEESINTLRGIALMTKLANDSSSLGLGLLSANRDAMKNINNEDDSPEPKQIVFNVVDANA